MKIFKKEKEVADLALAYLETAAHCVRTGEEAVLAYLQGDLVAASAAQRESSDLESSADAGRREIGDVLFSGAYLPLIRGDIFSVIEKLDKVPNAAESCCSFFLSEKPDIPKEFVDDFREITVESFSVMNDLRKAVKALFKPKGDIEKIRHHCREVSQLESRVDDKEWALTVAIFESDQLDRCAKIHLRSALYKIVHLSDVAENVADSLELTAMKSIL